MRFGRARTVAALAALGLSAAAGNAWAQGMAQDPLTGDPDVSDLSLEDLAAVEVTSVSRRPEALGQAAAAVYVITAEDIRRSGATSLPEVLRLAPNLGVQRVNAVDYAITARGFNGFEPSNKLLVLIDGRSVYTTLASGVLWDQVDVMLGDVERIEVVSGPGGALYGANAVNGVINIITRPSGATRGTLARATVGDEDGTVALRHGGRLGQGGDWRAYVMGFSRDDSLREDGTDATDAAEGISGGGRLDWRLGGGLMTLQGDVYDHEVAVNEDFSGDETRVHGANVIGRWTRPMWGGEFQVQAYFDSAHRDEPGLNEKTYTQDVLVQHDRVWGRHHVVVGLGHREVQAKLVAGTTAFLDPAERDISLTNVFVQDQIELGTGLTLTLGAKWEDNSFSGQEILPNVRLAWERPGGDLVWGAISRASRTPNRIERDLTFPGFLVGGTFESETLTAYEIGYRAVPRPWISFSISGFYNVYDELRTASLDPVTVFPLRLTNFGEGETWGVEAWGSVEVTDRWRISAGLATLDKDLSAPAGTDITGLASQGDDPDWQGYVRSRADLRDDLELDLAVRAVDDLTSTSGFVQADVRLGWRFAPGLELSLVGRDLLDDRRFETGDPARRRAFGRSVHAGVRATF